MFFCRSCDQLYINIFNRKTFEFPTFQAGIDQVHQFIVENVTETIVLAVVEMDMAETVDVKIHLAVTAHAPGIDVDICQLGQNIVNGGYGYLGPGFLNLFRNHIGRSMA